ncbi:MAG: hypothetical protein IBX55_15940 [Methyloprofundus sp.]|nr:hypothetical protein [Methyloprofundus sp.]
MSRNTVRPLDSFTGGGYGGVFKMILDTGSTFEDIDLELTNINISQVHRVELILNGDAIVSVPGLHLVELRTHLKRAAESNVIRIPFRDNSLKTDAGQMLSGLPTYATDDLVLAIHISPATQAQIDGSLTPSIQGYMRLSAPRQRVVMPRIYEDSIAIGITGQNNVKTFVTGPSIRRMFFKDGGRITELEIKQEQKTIFKAKTAKILRDLKDNELEGVSGQTIYAPIQTRWGMLDMLDTAGKRLEIMPTVDAAGDMTVVFHTLESVANPKESPLNAIARSQQQQR